MPKYRNPTIVKGYYRNLFVSDFSIPTARSKTVKFFGISVAQLDDALQAIKMLRTEVLEQILRDAWEEGKMEVSAGW
jgi:hypothetical protein